MSERETAVIFGAGSVGRGFLGQLFTESGYAVTFVDVDQVLVEALAGRRRYRLRLAADARLEELEIGPADAIHLGQTDAVAGAVAVAPLLATAVGARALTELARPIAAGLVARWQAGAAAPQNIILCENLHDAPQRLREAVRDALPEAWRGALEARVGFAPAVIARMSPVPTAEQRAADPSLIVAEPYKILPVDRDAFVGPIPAIVGMEPVSPFGAYVERKLYIHNAGHSTLGFLGYRRGYTYGYEAMADARILGLVETALNEAGRALIAQHGFDPPAMRRHVQDLLARFANRALADPISRLARDPLRKLAPGDRLVGAARLAERHGITPAGLAWGIAGGLAYDHPDDPHAQELQARLRREGFGGVLQGVCEVAGDEPLGEQTRRCYEALRADPSWRASG